MEMSFTTQNTKNAIIWADPQTGLIINCNKAAEILFKSSKEEIVGRHHSTIYASQQAEYYTDMFTKLTQKYGVIDEEAEVISSSGTIRFVQMTSALTIVEGKQIIQEIFHDIDDSKKVADKLQDSEERFRSMFELSGIGMALVGTGGSFLKVNCSLCEILGYTEKMLLAMNFIDIINKNDLSPGETFKDKLFNGKNHDTSLEIRCVNKKGISLWIALNSSLIYNKLDVPVYYIFQVQNITGRKEAEEALSFSESRYRRLFETAQDGILILDADTGYIVDVNPYLIDMLEYPREQFVGKKLWEIGPIKDVETSKNAFVELQTKKYIRYENMPLQTKSGKIIDVEFVSNVYGVDGLKVIQCNIRNITARRNIEKALFESKERFKKLSFHDSLTGLYNRTYFAETMTRLDKDLARSTPVSIMSIDIDGLKLINDTFGHQSGDALLKAAAELILRPFRRIDIVARLGGDEFCVILPHTDNLAALEKRNEIADMVKAYSNENPAIHLHMSIGVATSQDDENENIYGLYQRADEEMYKIKNIRTVHPKDEIVDILLTALAERDFINQGHAERLSKMAETMADKMHLNDDTRKNLVLLAKVHDLGKVSIPDKILFKPDILTDEERAKMKEHAQKGYNLANRSKALSPIAGLILHHHEYWDGQGYPEGLQGEQIPLEDRLFSIMDAYDALTNIRPYRKGVSKQEALTELKSRSGTQFEPKLLAESIQYI